jgi:ABC-type sugar transport system ATPase subunit
MEKEVLMQIKDICKTFGPTKAVDHVSFDLYKGEIRGLIGENGSGKSTISSIISGIQAPDSGEMLFENQPYVPANQNSANKKGISMVVQEMCTLEGLTVAENIFFGNEDAFMRNGIKNIKKMNDMAKEQLKKFGLDDIDPAQNIANYTFEERKLVELVRAVYFNPQLIIIDETTTALSQKGRNRLYDLMRSMRQEGNSVIFISHDLQEVLDFCNNITVFRDGKYIDTVQNLDGNLDENDLKRLMVGRELNERYYREDFGTPISDEVVLEVRNVTVEGILHDIDFELHKGEILGIGGLSDSGMHEIGKVLFGALSDAKGTVTLKEKGIAIKNIPQAISEGMGYVSKNRDQEALITQASIMDNVCISSLDKLQSGPYISPKKEYRYSTEYVTRLSLKMQSVKQFVSDLSGGNKQKVALAKWLARGSDILVLDSPTRGIDVMVKAAIYELMENLKAQGKSIILISEEMLELIGMSDRILIIKNGAISGEFGRSEDLNEEKIIHCMI